MPDRGISQPAIAEHREPLLLDSSIPCIFIMLKDRLIDGIIHARCQRDILIIVQVVTPSSYECLGSSCSAVESVEVNTQQDVGPLVLASTCTLLPGSVSVGGACHVYPQMKGIPIAYLLQCRSRSEAKVQS